MIRAVIFDFDGLILDTEMPAFRAWQELYEEHGCELPFEQWAMTLGGSGEEFDPLRHLEEMLGRPIDRDALSARRRARKMALIEMEQLRPGVLDRIGEAQRLGLKLAVASSSPRDWVTSYLCRHGIDPHFACIVCAEDVARVKPDPALFLKVLQTLGVQPEETIVFEDAPHGVAAARAAGIFCVAVPNALTTLLPLDHADMQVASLADVTIRDIINQLEAR